MQCCLCPHRCMLKHGQSGICRVRTCRDGSLQADNYGRLSAVALDPIEKKPLKNFYPGSKILSVGSFGCNLRCRYCQNCEIAQSGVPAGSYTRTSPDELVRKARLLQSDGNLGLAYTYNEPVVWFEYMEDCAQLIRNAGLKNVMVTNGMINAEPMRQLLPVLDAMNIDLKAFNPSFYLRIAGGSLEAVMQTIALCQNVCHIEVTTLIIPGENDNADEMDAQCRWLAALRPDIPLHLSRFFPRYKMADARATPLDTLQRLAAIARSHLRFVYLGNTAV